jgi:menaquinone-9 beta-reductase
VPLAEQRCANVCLVVPRPKADDAAGLLLRAIESDPQLRERFAGARMVTAPVVLGPLAVDTVASGAPGLLLAGDAAGFIDPMTGDGLRFAVRGGELAAEVALAALAGALVEPHVRLARLRRREFAAKWRFNRTLRGLVGRDLTVELAGLAAGAAPWILRRTIAFAGDVPAR